MLGGVTLSKLRQFARYHLVRRVHDYPAQERALDIELLGLELDDFYRQLKAHRPEPVLLAEVGYGGRKFPIFRVDAGDPEGDRRLLVLSGVHGNEQAGILSVLELLKDCRQSPEHYRGVKIVIVTPCNPVGASELSRYNADGFDINRDFKRFDTVEARAARDVFEAVAPDFCISLHEGPQQGAFVFANRAVSPGDGHRVVDALEMMRVELAPIDYFGRSLPRPGYAPVSRRLWALSKLWALTLGMMPFGVFAEDRGVPELTLETPWSSSDADSRIHAHVTTIKAVVGCLAGR